MPYRAVIFALFIVAIIVNFEITKMIWPTLSKFSFITGHKVAIHITVGSMAYLSVISIFTLLEFADNRNAERLKATYLKGLIIWFLYIVISYPATFAVGYLKTELGIDPLVNLSKANWYGAEFFIAFLIFDFCYYWFHRAQHTFPFLWRFHSFHHSIENLNAANSYHHWTEEFFRIFFFTLPAALLVQRSGASFYIILAFVSGWAMYIHTNSKRAALPWPLRYLIVDNVYHHAHHGLESQYHDMNYGAFIPIWDWLFGTQIMPKSYVLPSTGVEGLKEPSVGEYLRLSVPKKET